MNQTHKKVDVDISYAHNSGDFELQANKSFQIIKGKKILKFKFSRYSDVLFVLT